MKPKLFRKKAMYTKIRIMSKKTIVTLKGKIALKSSTKFKLLSGIFLFVFSIASLSNSLDM